MKSWLLLTIVLSSLSIFGQEIWMHPNAGQWDSRIEYKVELASGEMLIEADGFTYFLHDAAEKFGHPHSHDGHKSDYSEDEFQIHVIKSKFIGSNWKGNVTEEKKSGFYRNYFQGNDRNKWRSKLYSSAKLQLHDYYDGIDLVLDGSDDQIKYSFVVAPGVSPDYIIEEFNGQDELRIDENGHLHITNRFGEIIEQRPVAWVVTEGGKKEVEIRFELQRNKVKYVFPKGYDNSKVLVIDPSLTFSTFTGATADNWGMSATGDPNANLFGGGTVFGLGYPVTVGAYNATFNFGNIDVGLTKFTADGTQLLYSTYLGGNGSETPGSMICTPTGELYVFGLTSSANFPMAGVPFDNTFAGGPNISSMTYTMGFANGSDLYVAKMSADGTTLLASTFVGGTDTDGFTIGTLNYNYGDQFRGEIDLDAQGNVYVASNTRSSDFPVVGGPSGTLSGTSDAVAFKLSPDLSTMFWSGYLGGSGEETGCSISIASNGFAYIVGGTTSTNMPVSNGVSTVYNGGMSDGYLIRLNGLNGAITNGTYIGANEYDQTYFVELDPDDKVYVLGQSESDLGISPAQYGNPNAGQFIHKYSGTLLSQEWKTMIGAGIGHVEISPTAFLVSDCYEIYFSGWGGNLNVQLGQASFSTSNGFPVTFDAYQSNTNGSNFYIGVLGQDAINLKYGTFMGGTASSNNHVDGGTSRFDKQGRIYHAVCGACGGNPNGFTTTPGVWSETNQSGNCNLAAFKFELSSIEALLSNTNIVVCLPNPVVFNNTSINGNTYFWDFGDSTFSNLENPNHVYPGPGTYYGSLIVSDSTGCFISDTVDFTVDIGDFTGGAIPPPGPICPGDSYQLEAFGGANYLWSPAQFLDDSSSATPIATIDVTTDFMVIISDTCGIDTAFVTLEVFPVNTTIIDDTSVCIGNDIQLFATGGASYVWTPPNDLNNQFSATPIASPTNSTTYYVEITTPDGCVTNDSVYVMVFTNPPVPSLPDTVTMCSGTSVIIQASGAYTYVWSPDLFISTTSGSTVSVNPPNDMYYFVDFYNACGMAVDSVFVDVIFAQVTAGNDTIICPGESAAIWAAGAVTYSWSPAYEVENPNAPVTIATPDAPTYYYVTGTDLNGCVDVDSVFIDLFPEPQVQVYPPIVYANMGDAVLLNAISNGPGSYYWSPGDYLSCNNCTNPVAQPNQNFTYTVTFIDTNGCVDEEYVNFYYYPIVYVPNTFTPDGDEYNQVFLPIISEMQNVRNYHLMIFDRWGELIFESYDMNIGWDGTYRGRICQDGSYVWKIELTNMANERDVYVGHVNIIK